MWILIVRPGNCLQSFLQQLDQFRFGQSLVWIRFQLHKPVGQGVVRAKDAHAPHLKQVALVKEGAPAYNVFIVMLLVHVLVLRPMNARVLVMYHMEFFRQGKVQPVQDGGRIHIGVVTVVGIDKGVPRVIDHGQQNISLHERIQYVRQGKAGAAIGKECHWYHIEEGGGDCFASHVLFALLAKLKKGRYIECVQEPHPHVAQKAPKGISPKTTRRVHIVNVIVVLVVVVNVTQLERDDERRRLLLDCVRVGKKK